MKKIEREVLMIPASDHQKVVDTRRGSWARRVLRHSGLTDEQIDIGFGEDIRKWQEIAAVAEVEILLLPDQAVEIKYREESYRWEPEQVVRQKVPAPGKKYLLFVWTEPE